MNSPRGNRRRHGLSNTRLFSIWNGMISRATNPNQKNYDRYKHAKVCEEWRSDFVNFAVWALTHGYSTNLTIDRIDGTKGYCPENCRWLTAKEQASNRKSNIGCRVRGRTFPTLSAACAAFNADYTVARARVLALGWGCERAVLTPPRRIKRRICVHKTESVGKEP